MHVTASIFKAYDIRGVVGQTLDEAVAEHLGRAFAPKPASRARAPLPSGVTAASPARASSPR